ncbi:Protein CLEC16A [Halotydeus destructor]|nr:Protein CLEC16A [Halotydeus destructor]
MFTRNKGWFGGWNSKPRNVHSLDQLKYLYNVMSKNQNVSEQNKTLLVETLRSIAEILIWGDQNDGSVFDFFLEKNMLSFFLKIMRQKCGSYVCVQLLQTLNILFENIRNETSLYYLLSNNHVNSIIVHKFDFSDEEVMAYYISFLKTLSLKLNAHTIHFFFNEHTNDFPLYTEAIKFFNHSEKMVRIAVRTLTLNVFRVEEESMLKFVKDRTAVPYFSNLVWFIGNHVLEIDNCLKMPEKDYTQQMVIKLDDLVAEHLDHLHYLNDILLLNIHDLNQILTEHLVNRLLIPLYIYSLITDDSERPRVRISKIVSLFLLSQVFLIISYSPLVTRLVDIILNGNMSIFEEPEFAAPLVTLEESLIQVAAKSSSSSSSKDTKTGEDESMNTDSSRKDESESTTSQEVENVPNVPRIAIRNESDDHDHDHGETLEQINSSTMTDEEKAQATSNICLKRDCALDEERPFLNVLFHSLDCTHRNDDHLFIFALCLIYSIVHNEGIEESQLGDLSVRAEESQEANPNVELNSTKLIDYLVRIMHLTCQYNSRIRLVTLDMSILLLKKLVIRDDKSILSDHHLASIEQAKEEAALVLRNFYKSEEEAIFLDLFEEEYAEMQKRKLNVEYLMMDANLLLPPSQLTSLMMNGVEFTRRLPCADVERTRYAIRVFFHLRHLSLSLRTETETQLPLRHPETCVAVEQHLDLNNSDLIACTVLTKNSSKMRRFMVIDAHQLILIEPDNRKLGWGVAKFVALLQDVEVNVDKDDSRSLHITIRQAAGSSIPRRIALSAKFVFDDHIRCMAAKQRLTKGRTKARQSKMHQIAKLIDLVTHVNPLHSSKRASSSSLSPLQRTDLPKSHSQDGFSRTRSGHKVLERLSVKRSVAMPGSAISENSSPSPISVSSRRTRRRSASSSNRSLAGISRESSPRASGSSGLENSDEMIPLEDMSPKNDRRQRSRSENRVSDNKLSVNQEAIDRL